MTHDAHANFAYSTVATAPSPAASGTSLVVQAGDGAKFPAVPFNVTIWPASTIPIVSNAEIARCTARTTDTLTIVRAQEGSAARTVVVGDQIAASITAKTLTDAEDLIYDGDFSAGPTYMDGEIVVYNGIAYLCTKPTTAAPVPWPGGPVPAPYPSPAYGTSLPTAPVDGQEAVLVDSITNPTYQWKFRYNAGSSSAYKWEFVGGAPAKVIGPSASEGLGASTGVWLDTATIVRFIVPRAGDYDAWGQARGTCTTANALHAAVVNGAAGGVFPYATIPFAANAYASIANLARLVGITAGSDIRLRLAQDAANASIDSRTLAVTPVRVS